MGLYTKLVDGIYRFCLADAGIKGKDSCDSEYHTKCIDDTIGSSLGELNAEHSQTLEDKALSKNDYAVLLIDMQKTFVGTIPKEKKKKQISSQIEVLQYCSQKDIPLAVLEFKGLGPTIDELAYHIKKVPRKRYIEKDDSDGFTNPELHEQLNEWNVKNLILMGIYSSQCVKATAKSAIECDEGDYRIFTSNALISENNPRRHQETIDWFKDKGKYYDDYKDLIKQINLDTPYCK